MQHFKLGWEPKLCPIFSKYNKINLSLVTKKTLNARVTESKRQRQLSASINYKNLKGLANGDFAAYYLFFHKLQFFELQFFEKTSLFTLPFLFQ